VARILHNVWQDLWNDEQGQDIAEYAVMLAGNFSDRGGHGPAHRLERQQCVLTSWQLHPVKIWSASERDQPLQRAARRVACFVAPAVSPAFASDFLQGEFPRLLSEIDEERDPILGAHHTEGMAFARQVFRLGDSSGFGENFLASGTSISARPLIVIT